MTKFATLTLVLLGACAIAACQSPTASRRCGRGTQAAHNGSEGPGHHRSHDRNLDRYIAAMELPGRARWQNPDGVLRTLALKPGESVADIGAGPGYFTLPMADLVGPTGTVWAVDIEQAMLDRLAQHARGRSIENINYVLAPPDDPLLPDGRIDTVLIVNTYHHLPDREAYAAKLRAALVRGGRVVVIDFIPKSREERGFGPPLEMQLDRRQVDAEMATAGFFPSAVHSFLSEQYFVEYRLRESE